MLAARVGNSVVELTHCWQLRTTAGALSADELRGVLYVIKVNASLTVLDLICNQFTDVAALTLADVLKVKAS
ncbi:hypothetical protein T492DRAFT_937998 [Pavlovales sp. CCMP2436]|nr:hypothetical protein T492DRAFT_937998 [Pavlovales sp. CCMP2436]